MNLKKVQKYELTMDVKYRPDCLKDEFVLEKGFDVTNLVNFVDLEQIKLCLKDEFTRVTGYCSKTSES